MSIKPVLRMGDPGLLEVARKVEAFGTPELEALIRDMHDTMEALDGAGLAAPQIGVGLQVVIFGVKRNPRYPDAEEVPYTVLVNPVLTPLTRTTEQGWEGCRVFQVCAAWFHALPRCAIRARISMVNP